jgi:hypothetical protein
MKGEVRVVSTFLIEAYSRTNSAACYIHPSAIKQLAHIVETSSLLGKFLLANTVRQEQVDSRKDAHLIRPSSNLDTSLHSRNH